MITEKENLKDTALWWLSPMQRSGFIIYWLLILLVLMGIISLFFIRVELTVRAQGIIRQRIEKTGIRSPVSGVIDTVFFSEGDIVKKNTVLISIRDPNFIENHWINEWEILQTCDFIHDLTQSLAAPKISARENESLRSRMYNQKYRCFFTRMREQKIISVREALCQEQKRIWANDLLKSKNQLRRFLIGRDMYEYNTETYHIRAAVSGNLQDMMSLYPGYYIQAGEQICTISPKTELIAECFVSARDIGLLKTGQQAILELDASDYNYVGPLTVRVYDIDNDLTFQDKKPVFKVKCGFDGRLSKLSNGYSGELKNAMNFQIRFILARRSLWQFICRGMNDWISPVHHNANAMER